MKTLVIYWSWTNGNTETIARLVAEHCHADIEKLRLVKEYDGSYDDIVEEGKKEADNHLGRKIQPLQHNVDDYDRVVIGTPTWWYTMAPCIYTFLKETNLNGKIVIPFMTNAGWPGHVIQDMTKLAKGAEVKNAKDIQFDSDGGSELQTPQKELKDWIASL